MSKPSSVGVRMRVPGRHVGNAGTTYEFCVKLPLLRPTEPISDENFEIERELALEIFTDELRERYPWVGKVYLTGRSGGWLAIEDSEGKATMRKLERIAGLVYTELAAFKKYLESGDWKKNLEEEDKVS